MIDTKDRILDAAERLFAEQGYDATSMRHIIAEAGVNLAAIHYHFGSKEELLSRMIERRAEPINKARMALLDQFEAEAGAAPVPLERLLEAFLIPAAELTATTPGLARLMARLYAEGVAPDHVRSHFEHVGRRFLDAARRTLPGLPDREFYGRLRAAAGAMAFFMGAKVESREEAVERVRVLIGFLAGGLRAPAVTTEAVEVEK